VHHAVCRRWSGFSVITATAVGSFINISLNILHRCMIVRLAALWGEDGRFVLSSCACQIDGRRRGALTPACDAQLSLRRATTTTMTTTTTRTYIRLVVRSRDSYDRRPTSPPANNTLRKLSLAHRALSFGTAAVAFHRRRRDFLVWPSSGSAGRCGIQRTVYEKRRASK